GTNTAAAGRPDVQRPFLGSRTQRMSDYPTHGYAATREAAMAAFAKSWRRELKAWTGQAATSIQNKRLSVCRPAAWVRRLLVVTPWQEVRRSRRFAPRGEWTQYAASDPLRIVPRMSGAARGIPSA